MIPPADGLSENQLGLLYSIVESLGADGTVYCTYVSKTHYKDLCEFGVIGVATVHHSPWINSATPRKDGYLVWVTEKGHQYMRGEINVSKPCTLENAYFSSYRPTCKAHKKRHTKEEYEETRRTSRSLSGS